MNFSVPENTQTKCLKVELIRKETRICKRSPGWEERDEIWIRESSE